MKKLIIPGVMLIPITIWVLILVAATPAAAQYNRDFQFKSPSFNGNNASAHWLTIENQEFTRKQQIQEKLEEELEAAAREERNSFLNRFLNNLQSRIYSRLAAQLTDNLFSEEGQSGSFELEGNTISYVEDGDELVLTIIQEDGSVTEIRIPLTGFSF